MPLAQKLECFSGKPLHPSLMFVGKGESLFLERCNTRLDYGADVIDVIGLVVKIGWKNYQVVQ